MYSYLAYCAPSFASVANVLILFKAKVLAHKPYNVIVHFVRNHEYIHTELNELTDVNNL